MPETSLTFPIPDLKRAGQSYSNLRRAVSEVLIRGQQAIEALRVEVYWNTGTLILAYLEEHPDEARRGNGVVERLSRDLDIEASLLYRLLQFADSFPNFAARRNLTWTHYRELLTVQDAGRRKALAREAGAKQWPVRRLKREIWKQRPGLASRQSARGLEEPERGQIGVSRIGWLANAGGRKRKVVDLGFEMYRELSTKEAARFEERDLVVWSDDKKGWVRGGEDRDMYFYRSEVERVVDGDTLLIHVALGFGVVKRQYLRLRGLDAEPLETKKGCEARDFLAKAIRATGSVEFKSRYRDPYDRYLSDVWVGARYLNQELVAKGLAKLV